MLKKLAAAFFVRSSLTIFVVCCCFVDFTRSRPAIDVVFSAVKTEHPHSPAAAAVAPHHSQQMGAHQTANRLTNTDWAHFQHTNPVAIAREVAAKYAEISLARDEFGAHILRFYLPAQKYAEAFHEAMSLIGYDEHATIPSKHFVAPMSHRLHIECDTFVNDVVEAHMHAHLQHRSRAEETTNSAGLAEAAEAASAHQTEHTTTDDDVAKRTGDDKHEHPLRHHENGVHKSLDLNMAPTETADEHATEHAPMNAG